MFMTSRGYLKDTSHKIVMVGFVFLLVVGAGLATCDSPPVILGDDGGGFVDDQTPEPSATNNGVFVDEGQTNCRIPPAPDLSPLRVVRASRTCPSPSPF